MSRPAVSNASSAGTSPGRPPSPPTTGPATPGSSTPSGSKPPPTARSSAKPAQPDGHGYRVMKYRLSLVIAFATLSLPAVAATEAWVTTDRLNRRTCPSTECGVVGVLFFRERATIYEEKQGWGRITIYYDASCKDGKSEYVDKGNATCDRRNGVVDGKFAEWVLLKFLSKDRPADPSEGATGDYALVRGSDDYRIYKDAFAKAASSLIQRGVCSEQDFKEQGGWWKSANQKRAPVYFTYCGGSTAQNRLYLNAETGEIFR